VLSEEAFWRSAGILRPMFLLPTLDSGEHGEVPCCGESLESGRKGPSVWHR